ncbi:hypothetical protein LZ32DRAFT_608663 [Colletotrichum eremochloae]|nr:hypothetical protein LZ32DRAFT_608663 [Colletotrichum eremochloae]
MVPLREVSANLLQSQESLPKTETHPARHLLAHTVCFPLPGVPPSITYHSSHPSPRNPPLPPHSPPSSASRQPRGPRASATATALS